MPIAVRQTLSAEQFRELRLKWCFTQSALARFVGVSESYIVRIEQGKNHISATMQSLMECLDELHTIKGTLHGTH